MSASLVGSEMCIRDRSHGEGRLAHWARGDRGPLGLDFGPRAHIDQTPSAVSYTHLTLPTICSV
eukprot:5666195-Alexandrium_andersonii.AAC.1